jgi:hypothetical protein
MHYSIETLAITFAIGVCPLAVVTILFGAARYRASQSKKAWKVVEKYICP